MPRVSSSPRGRTGGWVLMVDGGHLAYHYNYCGLQRDTVTAGEPIGAGTRQVRAEFTYDGGGIGLGGQVALFRRRRAGG